MNKFVLASASPRRRELLGNIGVKFDVLVSAADESVLERSIPADMLVKELALLKAMDIKDKVDKESYIISADTVVVYENKVLEKPKDAEDAKKMLKALSGKSHYVYTGVCVLQAKSGRAQCRAECTEVLFRELSEETIEKYVNTGEPMDKAGAYGIQGIGALLVRGIKGDYFNVVGLPLGLLNEIFKDEFNIELL